MGEVVKIVRKPSKFAVDRDRFDGYLTTLLKEELGLPNNAHPMAVCAVLLDAVGRVWINTYRTYEDQPLTIVSMRDDILQVIEAVRQVVASADPLTIAEVVSGQTPYTTEFNAPAVPAEGDAAGEVPGPPPPPDPKPKYKRYTCNKCHSVFRPGEILVENQCPACNGVLSLLVVN